MKILTSEEMRQADAYTIEHEPIKSIDLMERAAKVCTEWIAGKFDTRIPIRIFCGLGNNGGDGLAIARLLLARKYKVEVYIVRHSDKCSADFLANEKKLRKIKGVKVHNLTSVAQLSSSLSSSLVPRPSYLVLDAIFGSGLNKPVEGLAKEVIKFINSLNQFTVSLDIPSGLFAENQPAIRKGEEEAVVQAHHTLAFDSPKLAFLFPENGKYINDFTILDIGLNEKFISSLPSKNYFVTGADVRKILKRRSKFSHKGTFGHALIVSGSYGKMGACVLASRACLSAGAGLVTVHIPKCGYEILQTANPEVMATVDPSEIIITEISHPEQYNAIGIGPGLGTELETQNALKVLIQNSKVPLVLDADALNILSGNKTWIAFLPKNSILTPHPGEFRRLVGAAVSDYERLQMQKDFAVKHGVYLILKGAHTCIACPDGEVYFNSTGNPGMATAGSGDVLTGIITGLVAQGYDSKQASVLGVFLHGLAGDIAAEHFSEESLIAWHIIESLGEAFKRVGGPAAPR